MFITAIFCKAPAEAAAIWMVMVSVTATMLPSSGQTMIGLATSPAAWALSSTAEVSTVSETVVQWPKVSQACACLGRIGLRRPVVAGAAPALSRTVRSGKSSTQGSSR